MSFKQYELAYCSMIDEEIELPLLWAGMCQAKEPKRTNDTAGQQATK